MSALHRQVLYESQSQEAPVARNSGVIGIGMCRSGSNFGKPVRSGQGVRSQRGLGRSPDFSPVISRACRSNVVVDFRSAAFQKICEWTMSTTDPNVPFATPGDKLAGRIRQ